MLKSLGLVALVVSLVFGFSSVAHGGGCHNNNQALQQAVTYVPAPVVALQIGTPHYNTVQRVVTVQNQNQNYGYNNVQQVQQVQKVQVQKVQKVGKLRNTRQPLLGGRRNQSVVQKTVIRQQVGGRRSVKASSIRVNVN